MDIAISVLELVITLFWQGGGGGTQGSSVTFPNRFAGRVMEELTMSHNTRLRSFFFFLIMQRTNYIIITLCIPIQGTYWQVPPRYSFRTFVSRQSGIKALGSVTGFVL
jgi:hypothetical protein